VPDRTIGQEIEQAKQVLDHWQVFGAEIERVRKLEMGTMMTPQQDRSEGYYRLPALQGYMQIVNAYSLIGNVTPEQRSGLHKVASVLSEMQEDQRLLGERPDPARIPGFAAMKLQQLETNGTIYLVSGHVEHFNITRITRQPDGSYNYTLYDAGHESKVIDWKGDRPVIQAVQEFQLRPGTDMLALIEADVAKKGAWSNSSEYAAAKGLIDGALVHPPLRAEEEYGQRKHNCTTRGQRIMAADILQDPALSEALYDFASNVDGTSTDDIKNALQARVAHLEKLQSCSAGAFCVSLDPDAFLKAVKPENFQHVSLGLDSGGFMPVYRTSPGLLGEDQLLALQDTLARNGLQATVRESFSQPGQFYLYVAPENADKINETLAKDDSAIGAAYRKVGENAKAYLDVQAFAKMADTANYEYATIGKAGGGMQGVYRSKPGAYAPQELASLQDVLKRNGVHAEVKDSVSNPGKLYLYVRQEQAPYLHGALARDPGYAASLVRHYGAAAAQHVEGINAPKLPEKPPAPIDYVTDRSLWHEATLQNGLPVTRIAVGEMRESQVAALEKELVKNGFRPERGNSATLGATLRLTGADAKRITAWQTEIERKRQPKQPEPQPGNHKPGIISSFLNKIVGQKIIVIRPENAKDKRSPKPGTPGG